MTREAIFGYSSAPPRKTEKAISLEKHSARIKIEPLKSSEIIRFMTIAHEAIKDEPLPDEFRKTIEESIGERTKNYYERTLANPQEWTLLVAKDPKGKICGILEAQIVDVNDEKMGLVHLIGVTRAKRRQGVATNLYRAYESLLRDRKDVICLAAGVFNSNHPSLELHNKLGITKTFGRLANGKAKMHFKAL